MKKHSLLPLIENKFGFLVHSFTTNFPPVVYYEKFQNQIKNGIYEYASQIRAIETVLDMNAFINFWNSPQISDLISDYFFI